MGDGMRWRRMDQERQRDGGSKRLNCSPLPHGLIALLTALLLLLGACAEATLPADQLLDAGGAGSDASPPEDGSQFDASGGDVTDPLVWCDGAGRCPEGSYCDVIQSRCRADCRSHGDCPLGQQCHTAKGRCEAVPRGCPGRCADDEYCDGAACTKRCGDGTCATIDGEDCASCPADCGCETSEACRQGVCATVCGDGACSAEHSEDCSSCPADCGCEASQNEICQQGACVCVPQCLGRTCGPDGCGGTCGECLGRQTCQGGTECVCQHACSAVGDECLDATTFSSCKIDTEGCRYLVSDACQLGAVCTGGSCCVPTCGTRQCGSDGCGGSCGSCPGDTTCDTTTGLCVCTHNCFPGQQQCLSGSSLRRCVTDAQGCRDWAAPSTCASGVCLGDDCCQPGCNGGADECGADGCGGLCGGCTFGCTAARTCKRRITVLSYRVACSACGDGGLINRRPDAFVRVRIGAATHSSSRKDNTCASATTPNTSGYQLPVEYELSAALRAATLTIIDYDSLSSNDTCAEWTGVDLSVVGTRTLTDSKGSSITIGVER